MHRLDRSPRRPPPPCIPHGHLLAVVSSAPCAIYLKNKTMERAGGGRGGAGLGGCRGGSGCCSRNGSGASKGESANSDVTFRSSVQGTSFIFHTNAIACGCCRPKLDRFRPDKHYGMLSTKYGDFDDICICCDAYLQKRVLPSFQDGR